MIDQMQGDRLTLSDRVSQLDAWALALPKVTRGLIVLMSLVNMGYFSFSDNNSLLSDQKESWFSAQLGLGLSNQVELVVFTLSMITSLCVYMYLAPTLFFMPPEDQESTFEDESSLDD